MNNYEKPTLKIIEFDTTEGYLALLKTSLQDDPQIYDDPTDEYN